MVSRISVILFLTLLLCVFSWPIHAEVRPIHFSPGASSTVVSGAVVRGTRDIFSIEARKGQQALFKVNSIEKNAALVIWRPGAKVLSGEFVDIEGKTLPHAGEEDDASQWHGRLPESGEYLIVIAPTRGNATYKFSVSITGQGD